MYKGKSVGVVIIAYNEEGLVGSVIDAVPPYVDTVYVVDDASNDGTWDEILRHVGDERDGVESSPDQLRQDGRQNVTKVADGGVTSGRVVAVRHETNRGVGGAKKTGYELARRHGMDVTAVIDGDGQMDPAILDRFLDPIVEGTADYAKGNRIRSPDLYAQMSRWRLFGNVLLTMLTKVASGYQKMNDSQNGYTAVALDVLETIDVDDLYDGYGFLNDVLITLNCHGFRVADVPMEASYGDETSGIRYRSFVPRLSVLLLGGFLWRLKVKYLFVDFHPLVFLYVLGGLGFLAGLSFGALSIVQSRPLLAGGIGLLMLLFSGSLWVLAMALDMHNNAHLEIRTHT